MMDRATYIYLMYTTDELSVKGLFPISNNNNVTKVTFFTVLKMCMSLY